MLIKGQMKSKKKGEDTLVCCHSEGLRISLSDKVVKTRETVTAEALPVLVSLLLVRLPWNAGVRWRCFSRFSVSVVTVAVGCPVVVSSPDVARPWLIVPQTIRVSVPG